MPWITFGSHCSDKWLVLRRLCFDLFEPTRRLTAIFGITIPVPFRCCHITATQLKTGYTYPKSLEPAGATFTVLKKLGQFAMPEKIGFVS